MRFTYRVIVGKTSLEPATISLLEDISFFHVLRSKLFPHLLSQLPIFQKSAVELLCSILFGPIKTNV
jgi:hypothetical protein